MKVKEKDLQRLYDIICDMQQIFGEGITFEKFKLETEALIIKQDFNSFDNLELTGNDKKEVNNILLKYKNYLKVKKYDEMYGVGAIKYLVNYHDGKKMHKDGSDFYDVAIFKNQKKKNTFIKELERDGYIKRPQEDYPQTIWR